MGNSASKDSSPSTNEDDNDPSKTTKKAARAPKSSYYTMIKESYHSLVNAIIRPPRSVYDLKRLGPKYFNFCGKKIERTDIQLPNTRGLKFECSMWSPIQEHRQNAVIPCVIYMHGNSSSRLEALSALSLVLSLGASLFAFDFSGSGLSEGEYVTLGAFERDDLQCVVEYLRSAGTTSTIALWGRSMGAATALLHGERDPSIAGMVLDSAFASLTLLAEEMVEKGRKQGLFAPGVLVSIVTSFVRSSVLKTAKFDIKKLSPIDQADKCFIPALFVAAEDDNFVSMNHSKLIYDKYGGDKNLIIVEGDHNSPRPMFLFDSVSIFLINTLQIPSEWILPDGQNYIRRMPWTFSSNSPLDLNNSKLSIEEMIAMSIDHSNTDKNSDISKFAANDLEYLSTLSSAELEMQEEVQSRLFNLMIGGGGVAGNNMNNHDNNNINNENKKLSYKDDNSNINIEDINIQSPLSVERHWTCNTCTLINIEELEICEACGLERTII